MATSKAPKGTLRHKHMKLDQAKLTQAKRILGAGTERETVEQALELVIAEAELDNLLESLKGTGTVKKVFR